MAGTGESEMHTDVDERVESLVRSLGGDDWKVRRDAVGRLGEIGGARLVEPLINVLEIEALEGENTDLQMYAAEALGKLGDTRAVEPLRQLLDDSDEEVRDVVTRALEAIELISGGQGYLKVLNLSKDDFTGFLKFGGVDNEYTSRH